MSDRKSQCWHRRYSVKGILVAAAIMLALSVSAVAAAQSSSSYQLGCWGVVSAGGDAQRTISPESGRILYGSTGQWSVGSSSNSMHGVQAGYMQPAAKGPFGASAAVQRASTQPPSLYLPFLSNYVRVVYVCPY